MGGTVSGAFDLSYELYSSCYLLLTFLFYFLSDYRPVVPAPVKSYWSLLHVARSIKCVVLLFFFFFLPLWSIL